jgi:hypothetical protein
MSTVAIIGNDAVLAAAPATPVQLAHACLRRGFTVAVPASWGDELVASEVVRRLASRERGPAVMCVCPFVRSRLLAPGPDLAPFLVSLVSPPVATARYLRAVYGEHGVHITYIGGCPSAEDASIDARLTPDAFLADIAEHGIALSEQPLVFDSIVPPDRRRWCSLPGCAPAADILWTESDSRTLVEIDRDDVSTDLAQHIITREHVVLDLAPGLGCVCSGAISSLPPRSARVAVTAVEPPRALSPVIEPTPVVSLDVPVIEPTVREPSGTERLVSEPAVSEPPTGAGSASFIDVPAPALDNAELESRLDAKIGVPATSSNIERKAEPAEPALERELEAELDAEGAAEVLPWSVLAAPPIAEPTASTADSVAEPTPVIHGRSSAASPDAAFVVTEVDAPDEIEIVTETEIVIEAVVAREPEVTREAERARETNAPPDPEVVREPEVARAPDEPRPADSPAASMHSPAGSSTVRRRTPLPVPVRHLSVSVPKTTATDGRALPRAYVAKRRTPPGSTPIWDPARPLVAMVPRVHDDPPPQSQSDVKASPTITDADPVARPDLATGERPPANDSQTRETDEGAAAASSAPSTTGGTIAEETPTATRAIEPQPRVESASPRAGATTAQSSNPSALVVLLLALIALGFFVLRSLS